MKKNLFALSFSVMLLCFSFPPSALALPTPNSGDWSLGDGNWTETIFSYPGGDGNYLDGSDNNPLVWYIASGIESDPAKVATSPYNPPYDYETNYNDGYVVLTGAIWGGLTTDFYTGSVDAIVWVDVDSDPRVSLVRLTVTLDKFEGIPIYATFKATKSGSAIWNVGTEPSGYVGKSYDYGTLTNGWLHVPEPPTLVLLGAGFVCVAGFGRRKLLKKN